MSNSVNEVVMVPREQLKKWQRCALRWKIDSIGIEIMDVLSKPAEQYHGEIAKLKALLQRAYDADLAARHCQPYNTSKLMDEIESVLHNDGEEVTKGWRVGLAGGQGFEWTESAETADKCRQRGEPVEEWFISGSTERERFLAVALGEGRSKCCVPTAQEEALLAQGEYRPEELWGSSEPSCPKCWKR